jgi:hypothetical protein
MTKLMRGFGLLIESEIEIPGCVPVAGGAVSESVTITQCFVAKGDDQPLYRMENGAIIFAPPAVGEFYIAADRIDMRLWRNADQAYAAALLVATALPALLWLRGHFVLHAASVQFPGEQGCTAIVGPSGAGKTATARQLLDFGAVLVGDDSLCLSCMGERILTSGLAGGIHRWEDSKRVFEPRTGGATNPVPLQRIIILTERSDKDTMQVISGVEAVEALLANAHRPKIPALLGRQSDLIAAATTIARLVAVLKWTRVEDDLAIDPSQFHDMVAKNTLGDLQ